MASCSSDDKNGLEPVVDVLKVEDGEEFAGGETSVFDTSPNAFGFVARNVGNDQLTDFAVGNSLFNQNWVSSPASTTARDGLGPFFNSRSCSGCHFKDGRGRSPEFFGALSHGLLLRLSISEIDAFGKNLGDPIYGGQFQDQSILGIQKEGDFSIQYQEKKITYPDGEVVKLRVPTYVFSNLNYGILDGKTKISPRVANQMIGLGLLEAISEQDLKFNIDENDRNNDGVSGRVNMVFDSAQNKKVIGRFGWKANQPNIKQQVAGAFAGDLGITSNLFPEENCTKGVNCNEIPNGGTPELDEESLEAVAFYSSTLAVPVRRNFDLQTVLQGKKIFVNAKCTSCHVAKYKTGSHPIKALENQLIFPYTDLLLHDMGEALADNASDFEATGNEWRTPPLWGIGLIKTVNKHTELLHDGRARNVEEAILWHGGEAKNAKNNFMKLSKLDRQKVITFINTL